MRNVVVTASAAALAFSLLAAPGFSEARSHRHAAPVRHSSSCVRHRSNNGTVIGAVGGGLLGHVVAGHGSRTAGTLVGAGVGAVAGHQIAKSRARSRC
jgi:uncharacterized protein YcfJ